MQKTAKWVNILDWFDRRIYEFRRLYVRDKFGILVSELKDDPQKQENAVINKERKYLAKCDMAEFHKYIHDRIFKIPYTSGRTVFEEVKRMLEEEFESTFTNDEVKMIIKRDFTPIRERVILCAEDVNTS
jgi:hypothetical protein